MEVYENLKRRTISVGIYEDDAEELNRELRTYAAEIDRLYASLRLMFRERFIETAEGEGLEVYERLFGPERTGESTEDRRRMLKLRLELGDGDFTPEGIRKALDSLGLQYTISEFPQIGKLNIIADTDYSPAQQAWIRCEVEKIIPLSVEFQLCFNTMTWSEWDALDRTFQSIDTEDQTWKEIDNRTSS